MLEWFGKDPMSDGYGSTVTTTPKCALLPTKFKEYHPILKPNDLLVRSADYVLLS